MTTDNINVLFVWAMAPFSAYKVRGQESHFLEGFRQF